MRVVKELTPICCLEFRQAEKLILNDPYVEAWAKDLSMTLLNHDLKKHVEVVHK